MKKIVDISIPFSAVITTIVYLLLAPIFFEMANALGEGENFVVDYDNDKPMYTQQVVETPCKSHCSPNVEMCIFMCE